MDPVLELPPHTPKSSTCTGHILLRQGPTDTDRGPVWRHQAEDEAVDRAASTLDLLSHTGIQSPKHVMEQETLN